MNTHEPESTGPELCLEQPRLAELEAIVERGLATFVEVGNALAEIRDSGLYRPDFINFKQYCSIRWEMSRPRAYQLIKAALVAGNLSTIVDKQPTHESQVRPLAKLEPEQQREAWKMATEATPTPTAEEVARIAESFKKGRQEYEERDAKERELRRHKAITKAFEQAAWFFYPNGNSPENLAEDLLKHINPELIEWEYSKEDLDEAIRVFQLVAKGLLLPMGSKEWTA